MSFKTKMIMKKINLNVFTAEVKRLSERMNESKNKMEFDFYNIRLQCWLKDNADYLKTLKYE
jgi:hypothetical protein